MYMYFGLTGSVRAGKPSRVTGAGLALSLNSSQNVIPNTILWKLR